MSEGAKGKHSTWAIAGLVALVALAGCLGIGDDEASEEVQAQSAGEAVTPQGEPIQPSEATQALWEKGPKDPYRDTEPTGTVHEFNF
jgi:hypothetical protein